MTTFHHPSSQPSRWQREAFRRLPTLQQRGRIPLRLTGLPRRFSCVPFVAAEVLRSSIPRIASVQDTRRQGRRQPRDIWRFRAADDEGQRKATPVHQQAALAPIFFPDPWGSVPRLPALTGLWSAIHRYSATSRQCRTARHTPSARLATGVRTIQPPATPKNSDESRSDSQTALGATPSIEPRFGGRTRFRQRLVWGATASVLPQGVVDIPGSDRVAAWESTARLSATRHRRLPMIELVVSVSCLDREVNCLILVKYYLWISS
jgi:hypothetical protein